LTLVKGPDRKNTGAAARVEGEAVRSEARVNRDEPADRWHRGLHLRPEKDKDAVQCLHVRKDDDQRQFFCIAFITVSALCDLQYLPITLPFRST
jgi:hypothetical protein